MNWYGHWVTTIEFSRMMGRPVRTVQEWAKNGTLIEFGIPMFVVPNSRRNNKHYIYVSPDSLL